jgi:hypothetical protein
MSALFRVCLKREPDPVSMDQHLRLIAKHGLSRSFQPIMDSFVRLPEFKSRHLFDAVLGEKVERTSSAQDETAVRHVVSLGTHCYTSFLLKRSGLKSFSTPFDWIFSSPDMVCHCLSDDFTVFLDRRFFEPIPREQRPSAVDGVCEHGFYRDHFGVHSVFNHHDPSKEKDFSYFSRAVARLRSVLTSDGRTLFVMTSATQDPVSAFDRILAALRHRAKDPELLFISIAQDRAEMMPEMSVLHEDGSSKIVALRPISNWGPIEFESIFDDLAIARFLRKRYLFDLASLD